VVRDQFGFDLDTVFEYGLQRLLDGITVRHQAISHDRRA
jgi:hypothetical protein